MKQITKDFQGWPVYKKTVKELLLELGLKEEDGKLSISIDNPALNIYPRILYDDGMGYGVNEADFTSVDPNVKEGYINVWAERQFIKGFDDLCFGINTDNLKTNTAEMEFENGFGIKVVSREVSSEDEPRFDITIFRDGEEKQSIDIFDTVKGLTKQQISFLMHAIQDLV